MRTSLWGRDVHVVWSWNKAWALPLAQNRYKRLQIGFPREARSLSVGGNCLPRRKWYDERWKTRSWF